ncbi:hypothetical protein M011DRAFT_494498 [Sporormia fimetaria CBS 119925]|uniref:Rhodopsin domain-containing protein n=1 Tax=Sporormia fimetaria CBS 119925 TaxID=1340428 RepID=A0A6A6V9S9_9PLEO|nr:hypothetical protein M011DRAFT_494498 [Sporormia fimetaria CBS 119925]
MIFPTPKGNHAVVTAFALTSLSTVVVALRFYSRYVLVRKLSSPDWVMFFALITTWGSAVVNYYQIDSTDYSEAYDEAESIRVTVRALLTVYIYRLFYIVGLSLIKISILLFYNYVTSVHKSFHCIVKALMCIVIASCLSMFIAAVLTCNPPSDAWSYDVFQGSIQGIYPKACYNPVILWYFSAIFNLVTDCIIWILPIPFVLHLQSMQTKRRIELAATFSVGIVAITASAVRLWVVTEWTSGYEKQAEKLPSLLIWGQVEQHAGIIAASIPFLRPLFRRLFRGRREQLSPSLPPKPVVRRLSPERDQFRGRTPIIPSPSPTFGSSNAAFVGPPSPLARIKAVYATV